MRSARSPRHPHPALLLGVVAAPGRAVAGWLLASVALGLPARAEEPPPVALSAEQLLARAGAAHPRLALLQAAVDEAAASVTSAGLWANPSLGYEREDVPAAGQSRPESFIRLELPLEVSGRLGLRAQGAELGLEAARRAFERDRASLLHEALGAYWSAAAAKEGVGLLRAEHEALGRLMQGVRSRTAAGDISGYDQDRLELEADTLADLLAGAERELDARRRQLGLLVGQGGARFEATDALTLPAPPPAVEGLLRRALEARTDVEAARLRVRQAERELSAGRRGWVPSLVLSGGAKSSRAESATSWGYLAGVSASLPVFDHGQGEAAKARARLSQAEAEQRLLEQQLRAEVVTAHGALLRALAQAGRFEATQLARLERLVRRAEAAYREGERPVFELLDAYRAARGVRLRLVELKREARLAALELSRAVGQPPGGAP